MKETENKRKERQRIQFPLIVDQLKLFYFQVINVFNFYS